MADYTRQPLASPAKQAPAINPFAQALAETEREKQFSGDQIPSNNTDLFSDALARTGGSFADMNQANQGSYDPAEQQRVLEEQRKKEMMRKKLHDQINPVNTIDIFNAREKQVKREIESLRKELKALVVEVQDFHKEVEVTLMTEIVNPGEQGKYYINFFQQLRNLIMLLRQKISSAKTWATQLNGKKSKKRSKLGPGLQVGGQDYEKTSTIQDMMHHERSNAYSGG